MGIRTGLVRLSEWVRPEIEAVGELEVTSPKKNKTLPVACAGELIELIDKCCTMFKPFPPSRSRLAESLIRDGAYRLLRGEVELESIGDDGAAEAAGATGG